MKDIFNEIYLKNIFILAVIGAVMSVTRYAHSITSDTPFKWRTAVISILGGVVIAPLVGVYMLNTGVSQEITLIAVSGLSMASREIIRFIPSAVGAILRKEFVSRLGADLTKDKNTDK